MSVLWQCGFSSILLQLSSNCHPGQYKATVAAGVEDIVTAQSTYTPTTGELNPETGNLDNLSEIRIWGLFGCFLLNRWVWLQILESKGNGQFWPPLKNPSVRGHFIFKYTLNPNPWGYLKYLDTCICDKNFLSMASSGFCAWVASFLVVLHFRVWWIYFCWFGFWGCVARWEPGGTGEGGAARMDFLHSSILPYHGYQTIPWIPNHTPWIPNFATQHQTISY